MFSNDILISKDRIAQEYESFRTQKRAPGVETIDQLRDRIRR
jgi:hypothetical protein